MMKKKYCRLIELLITIFVWAATSHAQTISGKLINENNQPLSYANVVLLSLPDSTFITGVVTDENGIFQLQENEKGKLIRISTIGYVTLYKKYTEKQLGIIQLTPDTQLLSEVVIQGTLPKTQLKGDAMVTNIQNSVLAKAGSANDVLGKIPGIIRKEDTFEVFGKGTPLIYINGRLVRDNSELEQLNSDDIKHIEVVQNPGARYDATVKAVIRIQTVRRQGDGFGFNLRASYYQSENTDWYDQLNLNYRHNNLDLFASLTYQKATYFQKADMIQTLNSKSLLEIKQKADWNGTHRSLYPTLGFNYQFNENHSMGMRYRPYKQLMFKTDDEVYSVAMINGEVDDQIRTFSNAETDSDPNHQLNAYYNGNIGKLNIDFNADLLHKGSTEETTYDEQSQLSDSRMIHTFNRVKNRLGAAKLVLSYPLLGGNLSVGSEYTYTYRKDDYLNEEDYIPSTYSKIEETKATVFTEYSHPLPFGSLSAGVRYEHVTFDYYEEEIYQDDQSRKYNNWYPNASFSTQFGPVQTQLSYTVKTVRPFYNQLGNAVTYVDRYSISTGNPTLKPELNHDLSLTAAWKFFQFTMSYQLQKDAILHQGISQENNDEAILLYYTNYQEKIPSLQVLLTAAPKIQWWSPRISVGMQKQWLTLEYAGVDIPMDKPIPYFYFNNSLELPKDFLISLDFNWTGKGVMQIYSTEKVRYQIDLSIRKSFLKDKLSIELKGVNLTDSMNDNIRMYSQDYSIHQINERDNREFVLTLRYKFNTSKSKYKGTGAGAESKSRM